jgi:DnaA N-terminal domain
MAQGLVAARSVLVSQNPAGWLRKAIEEDYTPSRISQRHRQRHIREKKDTKPVQAPAKATSDVAREQRLLEEEPQRAQNVLTEQKEPEKTDRENETTWNKALERLKADLPSREVEAWLKGTTLLQLTDTAAQILVPSTNALLWLERRLYREISNAIKGVLGKDLDLQFVTAS